MSTIPPISGSSNTAPSTSSLFSRWNAHHVVVLGLTAVALYVIYRMFFDGGKPGASPTESPQRSPETSPLNSPRQLTQWTEGMFQFSANDFKTRGFNLACKINGLLFFKSAVVLNRYPNDEDLIFFVDKLPLHQTIEITVSTPFEETSTYIHTEDKTSYTISKNFESGLTAQEAALKTPETKTITLMVPKSLAHSPQYFTLSAEDLSLRGNDSIHGEWTFFNSGNQAVVILHCIGDNKGAEQKVSVPFVLGNGSEKSFTINDLWEIVQATADRLALQDHPRTFTDIKLDTIEVRRYPSEERAEDQNNLYVLEDDFEPVARRSVEERNNLSGSKPDDVRQDPLEEWDNILGSEDDEPAIRKFDDD